jgi:hypothetical protein
MKKYGRPRQAIDENIIWCTLVARWITKTTDTYSELYYEILIPFQGNNVYANMPQCYVYTYIAYLVENCL